MKPVPSSLALLIDFYELTMAYGYWKTGRASDEAVFTLSFRTLPFGSGYAVACGLASVIEFLQTFRFGGEDLAYLAGLRGSAGAPLFEREFLEFLGDLSLSIDVDAVPEGTAVFPNEPLVRVQGRSCRRNSSKPCCSPDQLQHAHRHQGGARMLCGAR